LASLAQSNSYSSSLNDDESRSRSREESQKKPKKVTEKEKYETCLQRKKKDWRQFLCFMKNNPEALMTLTDDFILGQDIATK